MSSEQTEKWKMMWGAKVLCPNDLPDNITKFVIETVASSFKKYNDDFEAKGDEIVKEVKKTMDQKWGEYWHIIIGKSFGSYSTHESRMFMYRFLFMMNRFFYYGELAVMAFKSG